MSRFTVVAKRLMRDEEAAAMVEYAFLIALIALTVAVAFPPLAKDLRKIFKKAHSIITELDFD